jgi:hypothetical protein
MNTVRMWLDELEALPIYETTLPTGVCEGKCWRIQDREGRPRVRCYCFPRQEHCGGRRILQSPVFYVELLQGPRRLEPSRFKTRCRG